MRERIVVDISYLLWLQGIREALPPVVEDFFVLVSEIADSKVLVVIPCLLLWCLDKRAGRLVLFSFSLGTMLNQFIKNTACVYRPWIRSSELRPTQGALAGATGYSFPSGHTQSSATLFGTLGWHYRKRWPVLGVLCWAFVLLVAFSRNFLGVHAPQDVVVALLESVLVIWLSERLLAWVDKDDARNVIVLVGALVVSLLFLLYVALKPYPVHYDATGALLVDPLEMQVDCFKSTGVFLGALVGWFLEERFVAFEVDPKSLGWRRMLVRFAIGMAVMAVFHLIPNVLPVMGVDERLYELAKNFLTFVGGIFVGPFLFTKVERQMGASKEG